jgi:predicted MFS family arabinose efflux permease
LPVTAFVGGIAIGSALAGTIVEQASWRTAFVVAAAAASVGSVIAVTRRGTVVEPALAE